MTEPLTMMALAGTGLAGLALCLYAGLRAWHGWLELKRLELAGGASRAAGESGGSMSELIEMADLRERIRKLESIAACIDL